MPEAPRILALDLGRARIGVAITDGLGLTAQPLLTIYRKETGRKVSRADIKSVGRIVRKHAVAEIVVGNPLHASGDGSPQSTRAAEEVLAESGRARGASSPAGRIARKRIIDQLAAVLILESFLASRTAQPHV